MEHENSIRRRPLQQQSEVVRRIDRPFELHKRSATRREGRGVEWVALVFCLVTQAV